MPVQSGKESAGYLFLYFFYLPGGLSFGCGCVFQSLFARQEYAIVQVPLCGFRELFYPGRSNGRRQAFFPPFRMLGLPYFALHVPLFPYQLFAFFCYLGDAPVIGKVYFGQRFFHPFAHQTNLLFLQIQLGLQFAAANLVPRLFYFAKTLGGVCLYTVDVQGAFVFFFVQAGRGKGRSRFFRFGFGECKIRLCSVSCRIRLLVYIQSQSVGVISPSALFKLIVITRIKKFRLAL